MLTRKLSIGLLLGLSWAHAAAQQSISEQEARSHLVSFMEPVYPPIAKAAHVSGDVVVKVTVREDGTLTEVIALSGPDMLKGAAIDAVKSWKFSRFGDDASGTVTTKVTIPFHLVASGPQPTKDQLDAAQDYFPLSERCRAAVKLPDHEAAVAVCKQMLDKAIFAGEFSNSDQLGLTDAHELYGHALLDAGKLQEALAEENAAVDEAKKCLTNTDQEYGMPFYWRAFVEAAMRQPDATFADLEIAEDSQRRAIKNLPDMSPMYGRYLASMLKQHAAWLDQLGRHTEAETLRKEAVSLQTGS